jgi:outer membrane protein OmpA-like peptidoglycan-associated protein
MRHVRVVPLMLFMLVATSFVPRDANAQIIDRLKRSAKNAVINETARQAANLMRDAVRCVFDDLECIEKAKESGEPVVLTDDGGEVLMDDEGQPVTDPAAVKRAEKPGSGAWANYDFVPGDRVLFYDDFGEDNTGDFPRKLVLVHGSWEIVEWHGGRYLRATSGGMVGIPLPETLPEHFTIEYAVNLTHGNAYARVVPGRAYYGPARSFLGSAATAEYSKAGLRPVTNRGPSAMSSFDAARVRDAIAPFRVMGDGDHLKVYLAERRVANVPNAVYPRGDTLYIAVGSATEEKPILIGGIRVAAGGLDLYGRLERDGRAATQGILFATGSARSRPESTPTLGEIGTMLKEHAALRLSIEGHTDAVGEDAMNQTLSEERAAAVKSFLVETYGIDASRLRTAGFGESKPASTNDTAEGRQENRRVELVRLDGSSGTR